MLFLLALMLPAGGIVGFFVQHGEVIAGRGGSVPVEMRSGEIRIGNLRLDHPGGRLGLPILDASGFVRDYTGGRSTTQILGRAVSYADVYPGVTLQVSFDRNRLKADYLVAAGADPGVIRFRYARADSVRLEDGDLLVDGIRMPAPVVWQPGGKRILARYTLHEDSSVSFELGAYDRAAPLTIDPYVLAYGTFYGGAGWDSITSMAVDAAGMAYVAGWTEAPGTGVDAFVCKVDPVGNRVVWATYLRGAAHDQANAIAVDSAGNVFVAGETRSADFPVQAAYQRLWGGGSDAFVTKLNSAGAVVFSTFIGGTGEDRFSSAVLNGAGELWAAGETDSTGLLFANAVQSAIRGLSDAFVARFSADGALLNSSAFGGSNPDAALGIAVNGQNEVYFVGWTRSADFPVYSAAQPAFGGGMDAFIVRLGADGRTVRSSTYLGGDSRDDRLPEMATAVAVDTTGAAYVAGYTSSLAFPLVAALGTAFQGGSTDAFLARLQPDGARFTFSTYLGGNSDDQAHAVAINADGTVWIGGNTASTDLPLVDNLGQASVPHDGFLMKLNPTLTRTLMSTYLGASGTSDAVRAISARGRTTYVAGFSSSPSLLPSASFNGAVDGFVLTLDETDLVVQITPNVSTVQYTVAGADCTPGTYTGQRVLRWRSGVFCTVSFEPTQVNGSTRAVFERWSDGSVLNPRTFEATPGNVLFYLQFRTETVCAYSIAPTAASVPYGASTASFSVSAPAGCGWDVTSNAPWITVASGAGTGSGIVVLNVGANAATTGRAGTVTLNPK